MARLPFSWRTTTQTPPSSPSLSLKRPSASNPPMNTATTTEADVIVKLYQSLRIGLTNAQPYASVISTLSAVSMKLIPAANNSGKIRIVQNDMPCAACVADIPNKPISVAVSKPKPNKKPPGNTCQDRDTTPKTGPNIRTSGPDPYG